MLVEQAMHFENVVKNMKIQQKNKKVGGSITWDNAEELENYITKIQDAANAIMNENRRLRKLHNSILDIVLQLFELDLVRQKNVWRDKMD
jgi:dynein heavy chain 2